ncbi:glycosyltransferase family 9 protein [Mucilaginibacter sp. KACC 22063]|uniref:glycosyltransferase family 9 protein n=1 Tax=Mucilaginibacter sp. KACC 22063 TaxID=3025666 RepID=UPI00236509C5|nr:glycosyltransferase family 9 protein [Mucilaginibacter sp. KACC 22063]WDF54608.1 glycosyltransferase family 9 protein [Mucilaginibacter sp. KACC 22063]
MKLPANEIKKIGIFRVLQLGDMLCTIPAIRALKHAYPNASITLIGLPWAKSFTERFDVYFDNFIHFPGFPGLPEQAFDATQFAEFLPSIQNEQFDLVIQMQGNGTLVNPMMELFGARHVAGFSTEGHYKPDNGLFMLYPDYGSEIERHILLMEHLGIPAQGTELEFPLTDQDMNDLDNAGLEIDPGNYVCVHPGSRGAWRQWPVNYFATLADYCIEQGYKAVITGTKDEAEIVDAVISHMRYEPINACGKTTMGAMGVLIKNAAMLISNCTGVSHIAAAFKTPSVVISMDGEPQRWGPMDKRMHRTINWLETPDFHSVFRETVEMVSMAHS